MQGELASGKSPQSAGIPQLVQMMNHGGTKDTEKTEDRMKNEKQETGNGQRGRRPHFLFPAFCSTFFILFFLLCVLCASVVQASPHRDCLACLYTGGDFVLEDGAHLSSRDEVG